MSHRSSRHVARRRTGAGTSLAAVLGLSLILPATWCAGESAVRSFDIPAGDAAVSLKRFMAQAGEQVLYSPDDVRGIRTQPIRGEFPPIVAVARMLEGTPLKARQDEKTKAIAISANGNAPAPAPKEPSPATPPAAHGPNPTDTMKPRNPFQRLASWLALAAAPLASAQSIPAAASANPALEEAVELSPFTVSADKDVGYQATDTLAGSRLNTSLKDTAASISVLTAEFLADIGATNLDEALTWGTNVQMSLSDEGAVGAAPNDNNFYIANSVFRVRGIRGTLTRNYFDWALPIDTYNVDRIEESRGPNSILFGIGSAGGIINTSTKQPMLGRSFRRAGLTFGSYNEQRGTLDINQTAFNGKVGVRLNAMYSNVGSFRTHSYNDKNAVHLAVKYAPTTSTRLRVEYENGASQEVLASNGVTDGITVWLGAGKPLVTAAAGAVANNGAGIQRYGTAQRITMIDGAALNLRQRNFAGGGVGAMVEDASLAPAWVNPGGPGNLRNSDYEAVSLYLEKRFGRNTHAELAYNHQDLHSRIYQATDRNLSADLNTLLPDGTPNPRAGQMMFDGSFRRRIVAPRSDITRLSLSHEQDFGKWGKYRLAGMGEYNYLANENYLYIESWEASPFNATPENANNQVFRRNYVSEGDWGTYFYNGPGNTGLIRDITNPSPTAVRAGIGPVPTLSSTWVPLNVNQNDDGSYQKTLLLGGQARYWKDRLVLGFGFRWDWLEMNDRGVIRDPPTNMFAVDYQSSTLLEYSGRTRTLGAVYHASRNISLFYNQSDNFSLPARNIRLLPDSMPAGNPEGEGRDYGVAVTLLEGRLYARGTYYTSSVVGEAANHGFGSSISAPGAVIDALVNPLIAEGLITDQVAAPYRNTSNGVLFDRVSEGFEVSLTANLTKNWRLQANYSTTEASEDNIGVELRTWANEVLPFFRKPEWQSVASGNRTIAQVVADFESAMADQFALEGEGVGGNRKHKVSFFTRYGFDSGLLKGLFIGGGYRHQSKNVAGRNGPQGEFRYGRSWWLADALVGYRFPKRIWKVKGLNLQLNVSNLFDDETPLVTHMFNDGSIRRWYPIAPRTWRLSANLEF